MKIARHAKILELIENMRSKHRMNWRSDCAKKASM